MPSSSPKQIIRKVVEPKKPRRDWLLRALVTAALSMLIKGNAKMDQIDVRLARVETALEFIAAPKHSLMFRPQPYRATFGIEALERLVESILKGK